MKDELFYISRGNIVNGYKVSRERPTVALWMSNGNALFSHLDEVLFNFYEIEKFIPELKVDPGKCMLIRLTTEDANTIKITVLDRDVKCEMSLH